MKSLLPLGALAFFTASAPGALIITGTFDGPLPGGDPKGVELYATTDIPDLSLYGIGSANNGGGTDGVEAVFPTVSLSAGDFYYVTNGDGTDFAQWFGFASDFQAPGGAVGHNGDDAIEIFFDATGSFAGSETVVDTFGDINTDGSGEAWDNLDGWSYRKDGVGANGGVFVASDFTYSGINVWDGADGPLDDGTNAASGSPMPIGTFIIPEPSTALLGGLGLLALLRRRRA